jgi:NADH:ubiquinone oxidoreductase subunit D
MICQKLKQNGFRFLKSGDIETELPEEEISKKLSNWFAYHNKQKESKEEKEDTNIAECISSLTNKDIVIGRGSRHKSGQQLFEQMYLVENNVDANKDKFMDLLEKAHNDGFRFLVVNDNIHNTYRIADEKQAFMKLKNIVRLYNSKKTSDVVQQIIEIPEQEEMFINLPEKEENKTEEKPHDEKENDGDFIL